MASRFLLQIIYRDTGEVVQFEPGLSAEKLFIEDCVEQVCKQKVGLFRTHAQVKAAVRIGIERAILELKAQIKSL